MQKDFLWGAGSSSHQVEGGNDNNWSVFELAADRLDYLKSKNKDTKDFISGQAADHYNRYEEDFALAKSLSHNATRISFEWSRVVPQEGVVDEKEIEHYIHVLDGMRANGLEPVITLWHWTLPFWLSVQGGVASARFADHFKFYTEQCVRILQGRVRYVITINEPEVTSFLSYVKGVHPPCKKYDFVSYYKASVQIKKAHVVSYSILKNAGFLVGVASHQINFVGHSAVSDVLNYWNDFYLSSMSKYLDFIGVNYYFQKELVLNNFYTNHASSLEDVKEESGEKKSDMGWRLDPRGLGGVMDRLCKKYNLPMIVTEYGLADSRDKYREWYIKEGVDAVMEVKNKGANVFGFLYWSLTDNFEWQDGFYPRFGLIEVDYTTQKRTIRQSAYKYQEIIKRHQ